MNCNECIHINPIPSCLPTDETEFFLSGFAFPNNTDEDIAVKVLNTATRRIDYLTAATDNSGNATLDLGPIMPLMDHVYELTFIGEDMLPATVEVGSQTSCCIDFETQQGVEDIGWTVSTGACEV